MWILEITGTRQSAERNANNVLRSRRTFGTRTFKEFSSISEMEIYIEELKSEYPKTNKYGNTTTVTGTKRFEIAPDGTIGQEQFLLQNMS